MSRALDSRDEMAQRKITAAEEASEAAEKARAEVEIKLGEGGRRTRGIPLGAG